MVNVVAQNHLFSDICPQLLNFVRKDNDLRVNKARFCPENGNDPYNACQRPQLWGAII